MARRNEFYEGIRDAMLDGIESLKQGKTLTRREVSVVPLPNRMTGREVHLLRVRKLRVSQHVFAHLLNVAPATVQAWEQGRNRPTGATLRLLRLAEKDPTILSRLVGRGRALPMRRAGAARRRRSLTAPERG